MRIRHQFPNLLAGFSLAVVLSAFGGSWANADDLVAIKQLGLLRVGVKADYPPFGFRSTSGRIEGIEPSLAADIAKDLGVELELVPVIATNRIQLLEQGKIDLIIATMNGTLLRRAAVDIVKPHYYAAGYNVMVPKSMQLTSWTQLKGQQVCGIEDAYYNYAAAMNFELRVITYTDAPEALAALKQGRCAGLLFDDAWIEGSLPGSEQTAFEMPLQSQEVQPWGLAVRKGQPEWTAFLSAMVRKWAKDGTILDLETKYHVRHSRFAEEAHMKSSSD